MLPQERYEEILNILDQSKVIKVSELCDYFGVSIETIRRDLEHLESEGHLKRVYGGAISLKKTSAEPSYNARFTINPEEKKAIARKTAELVKDGETLIIDLGTTTLEVAKHLRNKKNLTIITNCLSIAQELVDIPGNRVFLSGGQLRVEELTLSGYLSEDFFKQFNVDKTIIGVGGITIDGGISDYHIDENKVRKIMIEKGEQVIAVADHSKFGVKALINVCSLDKIDILVSDYLLPKDVVDKYRKNKVNIVIAEKNQ